MGTGSSRFIILHTNDIHSNFENMPKLAARIKRYREQYGQERSLLVDCGDHLDRVRVETEGTEGVANIAIMNETGYEVFVPGNNEGLTFPKRMMETAFEQHARFAVLGTNMKELETGQHPPWMTDRLVIDKSGFRIGIVGVTASYRAFYELLGWDVGDPLQAVASQVGKLREEVDFLLVISHVGIHFDRQLAEQVAGIDYIVGGHTHHLLEQAERHGQTWIGAAGKLGTHLGVIELEWDADASSVRIVQGGAQPVLEEADDPRIQAIIEEHLRLGQVSLDRTVAELAVPLDHDLHEESELGNLLADGIRRWTDSEIGIVNSGQLLSGLSAGRRTEADMLAICPSPINPCSMTLSGQAIVQALEESLLAEYVERPIRGFGFRGKQLGILCLSGMEVEYDPNAPDYAKVKRVTIGSAPLQLNKAYKVGTIDMFTFGIGYLSLATGADIHYYLPEFIRDVLKRELHNPGSLARSKLHHWHLIVS